MDSMRSLQTKNGMVINLDECHYYVSRSLEEKNEGPYCFRSIKEAAKAIPDGNREKPSVLYLEQDVYWTNGTPDSVGLVIQKEWLTLCGLGKKPEDTVIADNRGHMVNAYPADNSASSPAQTMIVNGNGFRAENLTIGNYLNFDLEYPLDPSQNRKRYSDIITQAYAIGSQGKYDCWSFENCRILGMLDTLSFHHNRVYFHNSLIRGTKDFIGGGDYAVYEECQIEIFDTCPMYMAREAATVYRNCKFTVQLEDFDTLYLTKFGGQLVLDNCSFCGNCKIIEWELETKKDARCYWRNVTLNGYPVAISQASPWNSIELTKKMEGAFSNSNMLGGNDGWNPTKTAGVYKTTSPVRLLVNGADNVRYGETTELTIETWPKYFEMQDMPNLYAEVDIEEPTEQIHEYLLPKIYSVPENSCGFNGLHIAVTGQQEEAIAAKISVTVSVNGIIGVHTMQTMPKPQKAPEWIKFPKLVMEKNVLKLEYQLNLTQEQDCSDIIWKRERDGRILAVSNGKPCRQYRLREADIGSAIVVEIIPKSRYSISGECHIEKSKLITEDMVDINKIQIWDFQFFPTIPQSAKIGDFFIDAYRPLYHGDEVAHVADWIPGKPEQAWTYGRGRDGAKRCWGLTATARGASLQYRKGKWNGGMKVTVVFCPDKDTGEGFGSANGQFIELFLKYDAKSRTGYGLRIERLPQQANGCAFSLRHYENGKNHCLTTQLITSAYMPSCTVTLEATNGRLTAYAKTDWMPQPKHAKECGCPHEVTLACAYLENGYGDVEIHHTGTVPIGNRTTIASLEIEYI